MNLATLLLNLLFPLLLAVAAGLVGRLWRRPEPGDLEALVVTVTLGLGTLGTVALGLGLVGWLRPLPVLLLTLGLCAVALLRERGTVHRSMRASVTALCRALGVRGWVAGAAMACLALYPPTGFDATVYHLPYARAFARSGEVPFQGDLLYPIFPQLNELLFSIALLFASDRAARLTQVLAVLLSAALLYGWAKRRISRRAGEWAAALWLGTPLVLWIGASAYIDVGLSLFVTAALVSWDRWREGDGRGWLVAAAACAGFAAGGKYLGLFFCGALGVMTLARRGPGGRLVAAGLFGGVALLVAAPWYLRILYHTGNPLFPFYTSLFGANVWSTDADGLTGISGQAGFLATLEHQLRRVGEGLLFLLLVPWRTVFERSVFHFQAPLSPAFLLLLPVAVPLAGWNATARRWLLLTLAYCLVWLTTLREIRFLLPILPPLILSLMVVIEPRLPRWRWLTAAVALVLFLPGPVYTVYKAVKLGPLPVTLEAQERYLETQLPGYAAIAWLDRQPEPGYTLYALYGHRLQYYAGGRLLGSWFGPWKYSRLLRQRGDPGAICDELHAMGASHFLEVAHSRHPPLLPPGSGAPCLEPLTAGRGYRLFRVL